MTTLLENIIVEMNTDYANDDRDGALTIAFDHAGHGEVVEWLDDDGSLCADCDSNLRDEYEDDAFDDVGASCGLGWQPTRRSPSR